MKVWVIIVKEPASDDFETVRVFDSESAAQKAAAEIAVDDIVKMRKQDRIDDGEVEMFRSLMQEKKYEDVVDDHNACIAEVCHGEHGVYIDVLDREVEP